MGIQGLLPLLKTAHTWRDLSDYHGQTLAVDGYVWLHKGAFGCAEDLVLGRKTTKFVDYCMHKVRLLKYHGIKPYLVFDGGYLPAKAGTEVEREKRRRDNLEKAKSFRSQGRLKDAREMFTKCVDVTPEMAFQFIKALQAEDVSYIVAPYEADAQLAYLELHGYVDGIITEDSDLLVFGCRKILFKLDGEGKCCEIRRETLGFEDGSGGAGGEWRFDGWGDGEFRHMAILSGCDYINSIQGIGIKTAHKLLRKYKSVEKVVQHLRLEGKTIPPDYPTSFRLAELTFLHQRVFDPESRSLVPLNPFPEEGFGEEEDRFIGPDIQDLELARGISRGEWNPVTKKRIVDPWPDFSPTGLKTFVNRQPKINEMFSKATSSLKVGSPSMIRRTVSLPQQPHKLAFGPTPLSGKRTLSELTPSSRATGLSAVAKGKMRAVEMTEFIEPVEIIEEQSKFFFNGGSGGDKRRKKPANEARKEATVELSEPPLSDLTRDNVSSSSISRQIAEDIYEGSSSVYSLSPGVSSSRAGSPSRVSSYLLTPSNVESHGVSSPTPSSLEGAQVSSLDGGSPDEGYISSSPPRFPSDLPSSAKPRSKTTQSLVDESTIQEKGGVDLWAHCADPAEADGLGDDRTDGGTRSESICSGISDGSDIGSGISGGEIEVDEEEHGTEKRMERIAVGWRERFSLKRVGFGDRRSASESPPFTARTPTISRLSFHTSNETPKPTQAAQLASASVGTGRGLARHGSSNVYQTPVPSVDRPSINARSKSNVSKSTPRSAIIPPRFDLPSASVTTTETTVIGTPLASLITRRSVSGNIALQTEIGKDILVERISRRPIKRKSLGFPGEQDDGGEIEAGTDEHRDRDRDGRSKRREWLPMSSDSSRSGSSRSGSADGEESDRIGTSARSRLNAFRFKPTS